MGCAGLWLAGAPLRMPLTNAAAGAAGLALVLLAPAATQRVRFIALIVAVAAVASTLAAGPAVEDVRRWLAVGPVLLQPGLIAVPVAVAVLAERSDVRIAVPIATLALLLAAQPDRACALALAAGTAAIAIHCRTRTTAAAALAAGIGAAIAIARPDPLGPVRYVEGVLVDAAAAGGARAALAAFAVAAMVLPLAVRGGAPAPGGRALAAVWLTLLAMSAAGAYPTPLLGYGVSGILGWFAAVALLLAPLRTEAPRYI